MKNKKRLTALAMAAMLAAGTTTGAHSSRYIFIFFVRDPGLGPDRSAVWNFFRFERPASDPSIGQQFFRFFYSAGKTGRRHERTFGLKRPAAGKAGRK